MNKICLINPPTTRPGMPIFFPMALITLGTSLQEKGIPFEIIDFDLELRKDETLRSWPRLKTFALQKLLRSEAQSYGFSSICSNFPVTLLLAQEIKKHLPASQVILGGPQPSAIAERALEKFPFIDLIAVGEGENTLLDLMSDGCQSASFESISGLAYRRDGKVMRSPGRPLIDDLDSLPIPDFSLVNFEEYLTYQHEGAFIEAGRGCPFLCSFCSTALMWERKYRIKSPERILKEMRRLAEDYGFIKFSLTHDNFTTSHSYVDKFCHYFKNNNHEKFRWAVSARADTINLERIAAMDEAGCHGFFFGVDSGSPRMQEVIQKHLNLDHFRMMLRETVKRDIGSVSSFVLGFPEETEEDLNQTIQLALWSKLTGSTEIQLHRLSPHEGTAIAKENANHLMLDPQMADTSMYPIECPEVDHLIADDTELFSSFYSLPTEHLGTLNVTAFCVFYDELINQMAPILRRLFNATHWSPVELFRHWMEWKIDRYPDFLIDNYFVFNKFSQFIRTTFYPKKDHHPAKAKSSRKKPLIFLGSTLPVDSAKYLLDADYRPPIQRGDLLRAVEEGYRMIGIIDGVFHQHLTVSVQEIRDALSEGVKIYGAASMGALRAAETYTLGVEGIGTIYNWYRSEKISADDEVAVCFDPDAQRPLSEALVNIRATLEEALRKNIIDDKIFEQILHIAQTLPFTERSYPRICKLLYNQLPKQMYATVSQFFLESPVDLKAMDAIQLLMKIKEDYACSGSLEELPYQLAVG